MYTDSNTKNSESRLPSEHGRWLSLKLFGPIFAAFLSLTVGYFLFTQNQPSFSAKIRYITPLQYETAQSSGLLFEFENVEILILDEAINSLIENVNEASPYSLIEVAIVTVSNGEACDVSFSSKLYINDNYSPNCLYTESELSSLLITCNSISNELTYSNIKSFGEGRILIIPLSITIPCESQRELDNMTSDDMNNIPRIGAQLSLDISKGAKCAIYYHDKRRETAPGILKCFYLQHRFIIKEMQAKIKYPVSIPLVTSNLKSQTSGIDVFSIK